MRRADIEVPNHPVDMDSWGRSACYPRGTFYPLSDHASTCRGRITSSDFRPCSTCLSHSQRSEEHTSELQSRQYLVCRLLLEKKKKNSNNNLLLCTTHIYKYTST